MWAGAGGLCISQSITAGLESPPALPPPAPLSILRPPGSLRSEKGAEAPGLRLSSANVSPCPRSCCSELGSRTQGVFGKSLIPSK